MRHITVTKISKISHLAEFKIFGHRCAYSLLSINRNKNLYNIYVRKNQNSIFGNFKYWLSIDLGRIQLNFIVHN